MAEQRGLADTGLAQHDHGTRVTIRRFIEQSNETAQLFAATNEAIERRHHRRAMRAAGHGDTVATAALHLIHRAIAGREQGFRIVAVRRERCDTDTDGDGDR